MATASGHPGSRSQANGVLPVKVSQTTGSSSKASSNKSGPKLKVLIRRLAPGLTEAEFTKFMGDDWKVGNGRVDWFSYKSGKDSKEYSPYNMQVAQLMHHSLSKLSSPSRAYLHLTSDVYLAPLTDAVRQTSFEDALNTWNMSYLLGPPSVEFALYGRIPSGRRRTDARQGTIDQDPEFMDFLETLANPVSAKESAVDVVAEGAIDKGEKVTITPLVQFLKDKRINKGKDTTIVKAAKHGKQESQVTKAAKSSKEAPSTQEDTKKSAKETKKEKMLLGKSSREAVKVLNRQAAAVEIAKDLAKDSAKDAVKDTSKDSRAVARERGSIAAAARILQRDLGLSPGNAHRKAKADAENAAKAPALPSQSSEAPPTKVQPSRSRGRGAGDDKPQASTKENAVPPSPILLLKKPAEVTAQTSTTPPSSANASNKTIPQPPSRKMLQVAVPSAGATRAFVKHANPSQGVTEALLKQAMEAFGAVSHVEIDKRKGFAYVDFIEPESLAKAMAANPTKIAQGTVQVLERKDTKPTREPPTGPSNRGGMFLRGRGGGGGRRGGRGGRGGGPEAASSVPTSPAVPPPPSGASS
jgi:regulator of nonsense transcripts 3